MNTANTRHAGNSLIYICAGVAIIALAAAGLGAVLMTEVGQMLNLPSDWVYSYFEYKIPISLAIIGAGVGLIISQRKFQLLKKYQAVGFVVILFGCVFIMNWFVPYFWLRAEQHVATFITISEADALLSEDADVFVLVVNDEARAYPRDWMMLPHIAGDTVGGEEVVMTYCALSDLPRGFSSIIEGQPTNLKVIAQVHNNLIFTDRISGELFQQITGEGKIHELRPNPYPVQRMPWHAFRSLYPAGKVFYTEPNFLDRITTVLFDSGLNGHYKGQPLFPTLDMQDERVAAGESVWGIVIEDQPLAVTRSAFTDSNVINTKLGGQNIVIAWYPEYETVGVFTRNSDQPVNEIDPYGRSAGQLLEPVVQYPGVLWMVWSHWFPKTAVLD